MHSPFALAPGDILAARAAGKFAVLMGIEGGHAIENSLGLLRTYHALGVRYMTLTWANSNEWADSSGDIDDPAIPHHNGLTGFGREVIAEMNRLGMMIDVSHVSDKTLADVLAATRAAGHRLALGVACADELAAQPDGRPASRACGEWRRLHGQLLCRVHRRELPPGGAHNPRRTECGTPGAGGRVCSAKRADSLCRVEPDRSRICGTVASAHRSNR